MLARGSVVLVALLLAGTAAAPLVASHGGDRIFLQNRLDGAGWATERFSVQGDHFTALIASGSDGSGEQLANMFGLYDGNGRFLGGALFLGVGGSIVDVTVTAGPARVTSDDALDGNARSFRSTPTFFCNAQCNPTGVYILAMAAAGEGFPSWGYAIEGHNGTRISNASGPGASIVSTRDFDGLPIAHASFNHGLGASIAQGASHEFDVANTLIGGFLKPAAPAPLRMQLDSGQGVRTCTCFFGNPATYAPGHYVATYDDVDADGQPAFLAYADVRLS